MKIPAVLIPAVVGIYMAAALRAMGKEDESWEMINKARYLYPDTQWLKSSAADSSDRSFKTGQSSTSNWKTFYHLQLSSYQ